MKQRMIELMNADKTTTDYEGAVMADFGLSPKKHYDVLVVAPGWKPDKILSGLDVKITCTASHSYKSGYEVEGDGFLLAWIQIGAGAGRVVDELSLCAVLDYDKIVFAGAVGAIVPELPMGTVCTPSWSIAGNLAGGYLMEDITEYKPFEKVYPNDQAFVDKVVSMASEAGYEVVKAPVFCTDSIYCEYSHMDFIRSFGVSLIEMETSTLYLMADLLEKPAVALLAVSDNNTTGDALLVRTAKQKEAYDKGRKNAIPDILIEIAKMDH